MCTLLSVICRLSLNFGFDMSKNMRLILIIIQKETENLPPVIRLVNEAPMHILA